MVTKQKTISFSLKQYQLWKELKTDVPFAQFIKLAFYEKIDNKKGGSN